jgi:hypothetical protein
MHKEPAMPREHNAVGTCRRFQDDKGVPLFTVYDELGPQYRPGTKTPLLARYRLLSRGLLTVVALLTLWAAVASH